MARFKDTAEKTVWAMTGERTYGAIPPSLGTPLPPGVYTCFTTMMGDARFQQVDTKQEKLLRFKKYVDMVIKEIDYFWTRQDVYKAVNLQYRRGILLYGPPGTGKSSLIRMVLDDVSAKGGYGFLLNGGIGAFPTCYRTFRQLQPESPLVVVIEDLERVIDNGYESELLDILDGQQAGVTNTVFVATTNYLDRLPDRLKSRPSRFDRRIEIAAPDKDIRVAYLETLFETIPPGLPVSAHKLKGRNYIADTDGMSLAHVKELFTAVVLLGADYSETIEALREMQPEPDKGYEEEDE